MQRKVLHNFKIPKIYYLGNEIDCNKNLNNGKDIKLIVRQSSGERSKAIGASWSAGLMV